MKKINLRGLSEILSEKELKNVLGGSGLEGEGEGTDAKPCENNGCDGPAGTWVGSKLCCLLPCFGILHKYGYGLVSGMNKCPW